MEKTIELLKDIIIDLCDKDCPQSYKDAAKKEILNLEQ